MAMSGVRNEGGDLDVAMRDEELSKTATPRLAASHDSPMDLDVELHPGDVYRADLLAVRPVPSAGLGLYATAPIPSGTLLILESPLLVLPEHATQPDLHNLLTSLPASTQAHFSSLAAHRPRHPDTSFIPPLRQSYTGPSASFDDLCESMITSWAIYETNRFTVRSASGARDQLGVFPLSARLNHSCRPNVFHRHNHLLSKLSIYALRDIEVGEQVCTSYIDIVHDTNERRRLLRHWGFKCACTLCTGRDERGDDVRRRKLEGLMGRAREGEARRVEDGGWEQWDYAKALGTVEEMERLMMEEELDETDTLGEVLALGAEYAMAIGWWGMAKGWAERALEIEERCLGQESLEWRQAKTRLDEARKGVAAD